MTRTIPSYWPAIGGKAPTPPSTPTVYDGRGAANAPKTDILDGKTAAYAAFSTKINTPNAAGDFLPDEA